MFEHLKDYIRPGAAKATSRDTTGSVIPSQPPHWMQQDGPENRNRENELQRMSQMGADISLELLTRKQEANLWITSPPPPGEGAILRIAPGEFISKPKSLKENNHPLFKAAETLNTKVCPLHV